MLSDSAALYRRAAFVEDVNWISGQTRPEPVRCRVKIRYRQPEQDAVVTPLAGGWAKLVFDTPQRPSRRARRRYFTTVIWSWAAAC